MSPQLPTSYENYPRPEEVERYGGASGWTNPPTPAPLRDSGQVREPYPPTPPQGSRRALVLGVAGAAVVLGITVASGRRPMVGDQVEGADDEFEDDPFDPSSDEPTETGVLDFAGVGLDVPDGWTVMADTDARALIVAGNNRVLVVTYELDSGDAAEELIRAVEQSDAEFSGSAPKPKTTSELGFERATATSSGSYQGTAARRTAELLLADDSPTAMYVEQIISARADSKIAKQAARFAADLRDSWPW